MGKTPIEWTRNSDGTQGHTWNPVRGCSMAQGSNSPKDGGCVNCYAARQEARNLPGHRSPTTGKSFAIMTDHGPRWTGDVELIESQLTIPLHRRTPTTYFVNSMSDLFHEELPDEAIDRVFAVMALCPQHTFQVLTKRPDRMAAYMTTRLGAGHRGDRISSLMDRWDFLPRDRTFRRYCEAWPLPNCWLGTSCETQKCADDRIPHLLRTPAAVRFVSLEPLLGPIDLRPWLMCKTCIEGRSRDPFECDEIKLDWVIAGGESGPGARPCDVAWIRSIVIQCEAAGVPCFVKQLGAHIVASGTTCFNWPIRTAPGLTSDCTVDPPRIHVQHKKGGDMDEWPEYLRVREMPERSKACQIER
jgi:protein gp37